MVNPANSAQAQKLAKNKSTEIMVAAEKGNYGIIAVCCVSTNHAFNTHSIAFELISFPNSTT